MKLFKQSKIFLSLLIIITLSLAFIPSVPDEGMFPLSDIRNLDLKSAGLKISIDEVYNPSGVSLVNALVKVGGCTGSFVSEEGLILTNHHCVFGAVQAASTVENNYLENGFVANTRDEEIPAKGLTCRITVSYEDVSAEVLEAADKADDISKRTDAINKKIREIIKREEEKDSTIKAEVSEMFVGESYVLFRYQMINDVRIVYAPPRSIGEFGGESDNWVWPRHTGDFSFLRAYVAPDGSPAKYSEDNIPFTPKKHLQVNADGVDENDFVFLLGYPGRTFKHQPSHFIVNQEKYLLPYISKLYRWMIELYEANGADDPEFALEKATLIKNLANVEKNYRGKLQGLERLKLVQKKQNEEKQLQEFINSNPELKSKYGNVLKEIDEVYQEIFESGRLPYLLSSLSRFVNYYRLAEMFVEYKIEIQKPDSVRKSRYTEKSIPQFLSSIDNLYNEYNPEMDKALFKKILKDALTFPELNTVGVFRFLAEVESIDSYVDKLYSDSFVKNSEDYLSKLLDEKLSTEILNDPLISLAQNFYELSESETAKRNRINGQLNILLANMMEVKRIWLEKSFIPDANSTLRLTYGYILGYTPADAVYYSPITSLKGVIEKGREEGDYKLLPKLRELYDEKEFSRFYNEKLGDVPVAILYNTDTSGGNSGSPIMDAYGRVVGVNFDRAFEATINDFTWSAEYSRSIGVDIRYILWVTQKVGGADFLLKEMGAN
ncbi:MAG: S46 family peptidase [Ignavibacterium sp.]|nr:S46 family peptidase [Ignavibacterium sp.]